MAECRAAFERARRDSRSNGTTDAELLRRHGTVVWGVVIEVCNPVTAPDAAVVVLYSMDDALLDNPGPFVEIARWVKSLKDAPHVDRRAQAVAAMLRCNWQPGACVSLALDLVDGREVYVATAAWRRAGLPGSRLVDLLLPIVVMPEATATVGVLPVHCWAGELAGEWTSAATPETKGVERRSEPRIAPAWSAEEVLARYRAHPVRLTPAAAQILRGQMAADGFGPNACVKLAATAVGFSITFAAHITGGMEISRSEGVTLAVVTRRENLTALAGVEIDWRNGNFIFQHPPAPPR
jgi:hypothetical protein